MPNRWGTSCFVSRKAAEIYYRPYFGDVKAAVTRKLKDGDIHIGKPPHKPGERVTVIPGEGRYQIEEGE